MLPGLHPGFLFQFFLPEKTSPLQKKRLGVTPDVIVIYFLQSLGLPSYVSQEYLVELSCLTKYATSEIYRNTGQS